MEKDLNKTKQQVEVSRPFNFIVKIGKYTIENIASFGEIWIFLFRIIFVYFEFLIYSGIVRVQSKKAKKQKQNLKNALSFERIKIFRKFLDSTNFHRMEIGGGRCPRSRDDLARHVCFAFHL